METPILASTTQRPSRKMALLVWIFPLLFSIQWILAALVTPFLEEMWSAFGSKLPLLTQFVIDHWVIIAALGFVPPIVTLKIALESERRSSVIVSIVTGLACLIIAQCVTLCQLLPLSQLGAVAGNV